MKKSIQAGFTFIELLIIITVIGILTAIALPSYLDYTQRAKFAEVINAVTPLKGLIAACVHRTGNLTNCSNGANGLPAAFSATSADPGYVSDITVLANGVIRATSQNIGGNPITLILTPTVESGDHISWAITGSCVSLGYCSS